jgi:hypothetical protein
LATCILEGGTKCIDAALGVFQNPLRHANPANIRQRFQPCGDIHRIAMHAGAIDDIPDSDPHAELDPLRARHPYIAVGHRALDFHRATQRGDDTLKQHEQAVTGRSHNPATVLRDLRLDAHRVVRVQLGYGALVVSADQTAIAGHIRHQDGRQPAFDRLAAGSSP